MLVASGHRPKEVLNWTDTERSLAANTAMQLEAWKIEQLAKALGGKK